MMKTTTKFTKLLLLGASALAMLTLSACWDDAKYTNKKSASQHQQHVATKQEPKQHFSEVYQSTDGQYYTRTYSDGNFWMWMYLMNSGASGTTIHNYGNTTALNGGTWSRVPANEPVPQNLTTTNNVVATAQDGKPVEAITPEAEVPTEAVVNEQTTEQQVEQAQEPSDANNDADAESDTQSSDTEGGDASADSSSSDSGGGGDGGGGGE